MEKLEKDKRKSGKKERIGKARKSMRGREGQRSRSTYANKRKETEIERRGGVKENLEFNESVIDRELTKQVGI